MILTIITYLVLVSQLYMLSYYYPNQFIKRISYVLDRYPASQYPKLYPSEAGEEKARKGLKNYKLITRSTLILGFILLAWATFDGMVVRGEIKDSMVVLFAMLQMMPFILIEMSELKHYKLMRAENDTPKRSADLTRRQYFDYASPFKFMVAALLFISYITFNLYRTGFDLSFGSDGLITLVTITFVHLYFAAIVIWIMYGKKLDPHQAHKDRDRHMANVVNTTLYSSMVISTFLLIYGLLQHYSLDLYEALSLSIFFQLCAYLGPGLMLRNNKVENINFDVYRADDTVKS